MDLQTDFEGSRPADFEGGRPNTISGPHSDPPQSAAHSLLQRSLTIAVFRADRGVVFLETRALRLASPVLNLLPILSYFIVFVLPLTENVGQSLLSVV